MDAFVRFTPFLFCKDIDEQLSILAHSAEGVTYEPDTILRSTGSLAEGRFGPASCYTCETDARGPDEP